MRSSSSYLYKEVSKDPIYEWNGIDITMLYERLLPLREVNSVSKHIPTPIYAYTYVYLRIPTFKAYTYLRL